MFCLGKNRDGVSILAAILEAASPGTSKTRIMFRANLSFKLLEKYLNGAVGTGFVRVDGYRYELTEHGREFLKRYRSFHDRHVEAQKLFEALEYEHEKLLQSLKSPNAPVTSAKSVTNAA